MKARVDELEQWRPVMTNNFSEYCQKTEEETDKFQAYVKRHESYCHKENEKLNFNVVLNDKRETENKTMFTDCNLAMDQLQIQIEELSEKLEIAKEQLNLRLNDQVKNIYDTTNEMDDNFH